MGKAVEWGIRFGIWWVSDIRRPVASVGVIWLNTLKGPIGNWARAHTLQAIRWSGRSAVGAAIFTTRTTWSKLIVPVAIWSAPVTVPLAVGAGVLATATVIGGVQTAALQKAGIVGPSAITTSEQSWFGGLEMNPYMFSMGTVV